MELVYVLQEDSRNLSYPARQFGIKDMELEIVRVRIVWEVNNGVVYLDYEDSHHHGPLLCSFQLLC